MLAKMSFKKNFLLSLLAIGVLTIPFQNCGQNMSAIDNSAVSQSSSNDTTNSLEPCIADGCPQASEYLQLSVENHDPVSFIVGSSNQVLETSVDISGYCNLGGFLLSRIYYSISDDGGNPVVPQTLSSGTCSALGRYSFPISIANLSGTKNYHITVTLRALDSTGAEYDNPLGRNRKQIGLASRTGI